MKSLKRPSNSDLTQAITPYIGTDFTVDLILRNSMIRDVTLLSLEDGILNIFYIDDETDCEYEEYLSLQTLFAFRFKRFDPDEESLNSRRKALEDLQRLEYEEKHEDLG